MDGSPALTGNWTTSDDLFRESKTHHLQAEGPGDFQFAPIIADRDFDQMRLAYEFQEGTRADLVEEGGRKERHLLTAPRGEIDVMIEPSRQWVLRLPVETSVVIRVAAVHWDEARRTKARVKKELSPAWKQFLDEYSRYSSSGRKGENTVSLFHWTRRQSPLAAEDALHELREIRAQRDAARKG